MNTEVLADLGLTNTEIKVYLSLLELGPSLASVVSKKASVERAVTYHILEKLIRKGIVSYCIQENRKYFNALEPNHLKDLLAQKESLLNELIPDLIKLRKDEHMPLSVEVFRGKAGLKTVLDDIIRYRKPYYIIGYTGKASDIAG